MMILNLATNNKHKLIELRKLLAGHNCISQQALNIPAVAETGLSFVENAIIKARHVCKVTNSLTLADDSGLVIDALDGQPGIYSSRYSKSCDDQANMLKVLDKLKNPALDRSAYFYCVLVLLRYHNDPTPFIATGLIRGEISLTLSGNKGFGYDPIFYIPEYKTTMANLDLEIKNKISHRAQALQQIKQFIDYEYR